MNNQIKCRSCCDENAECSCGFHSGHFSCTCKQGFYGTGLKGNCDACPSGFYWNEFSCLPCPDVNHETLEVPALSVKSCTCKRGFKQKKDGRCEIIKCPLLLPPKNGYFVKHAGNGCGPILNTACGARCKSGYQLVGSSIRLCQEDGSWSGDETECLCMNVSSLISYSNDSKSLINF